MWMEFYIDKNVQQYAIYHKDEIVHGWKLTIWPRLTNMDKSGSMRWMLFTMVVHFGLFISVNQWFYKLID